MPTVIRTRRSLSADAATAPVSPPATNRWSGVIGLESVVTGDSRMIEPGALSWDESAFPLPLRYAPEDNGGHDGAMVVGGIDSITRDGNFIRAEGTFDTESPIGAEAMRQVASNITTGISMDLDNVAFEYRISADEAAGLDALLFEDDLELADDPADAPPAMETDADGRVTVARFSPDDELEVTTSALIRAATIVAIPAFIGARIAMASGARADADADAGDGSGAAGYDEDLTAPKKKSPPPAPAKSASRPASLAASAPVAPPAAWFSDPHFAEPTPLSVTPDGRVKGHLAEWGTCHTGFADQCVSPPPSPSGYAYFRTGSLLTREGTEIAVGHLTMDTRHADASAGSLAAMRHYDHTGTAVADVTAGEDEFGIWVAGALRPGTTPEQMRTLRSSPLSGDWRRIGGSLELVAALAVNVPGFPVPRTAGLVASGRLASLTASGMVAPRQVLPPGAPGALSLEDLRYLKRLAAREREQQASDAARLARRVHLASSQGQAAIARRARAAELAARVFATPPPPPQPPQDKKEGPAPGAVDPSDVPETPAGQKPDPKYNGWLVRDGKWVFDPENDGDDDYDAKGDTDHDFWDADGNQLHPIPASPDGKQPARPMPVSKQAPPQGQPSDKKAPPQSQASRSSQFAGIDWGGWDGSAAMGKCKTAADYRSICAAEKTVGEPNEAQHWALPHHSAPGNPPNAQGVSSALGYFDRTNDMKNSSAAKAHLESHQKTIQNARDKGEGK